MPTPKGRLYIRRIMVNFTEGQYQWVQNQRKRFPMANSDTELCRRLCFGDLDPDSIPPHPSKRRK